MLKVAHRQIMNLRDTINRDPMLVIRQAVGVASCDQRVFDRIDICIRRNEFFQHLDDYVHRRDRLINRIEVDAQCQQIRAPVMQRIFFFLVDALQTVTNPAQQVDQIGYWRPDGLQRIWRAQCSKIGTDQSVIIGTVHDR